ncbi:outer membrane immunogenic protein [Faunimonas pinastri]|uniref:Outer membrane immunogenic protein n=1 Tax=Faunimonas pinastri TaxID=1855383 RepID=A0A1H9PW42_9HYPH|nr:outer membrane protein [Faunimonas pinastri]SER52427.1 outer membrane immunogenic protein [Faunimonas pinastri]
MKKILLLSAAATALLGGTAFAADLPMHETAPAPVAAVVQPFNWTGFYAGIQAGYAFGGDDHARYNVAGVPDVSLSPEGFVGGGHIGYNFAPNFLTNMIGSSFLIGVEGDIEYADVDDSGTNTAGLGAYAKSQINWQASMRGRLGWTWDRFLVYATGGAAYADVDVRGGDLFGNTVKKSDDAWGYTVGGGLEYALSDHLTTRVEYRYTDFGDVKANLGGGVREKVDLDTHAVRAAISYKF